MRAAGGLPGRDRPRLVTSSGGQDRRAQHAARLAAAGAVNAQAAAEAAAADNRFEEGFYVGTGANEVFIWTVTQPEVTGLQATPGAEYDRVWLDVQWVEPASQHVVGYDVVLKEGSTPVSYRRLAKGTASLRFEGLKPNTAYTVNVYTVDQVGRRSTGVAIAVGSTGADSTVPSQVGVVTVTAGARALTFQWPAEGSPDLSHYEVEVAEDANFSIGNRLARVAATVTTIGGLTTGTTYHVHVRAVDTAGNAGDWSAIQTGVPTAAASADIADFAMTARKFNTTQHILI